MDEIKKRCPCCKQELPLEMFHNLKTGRNGKHLYCRKCRQKYYQDNKELIAERADIYKQNNKTHINELQRNWYRKNKEKKIADSSKHHKILLNKWLNYLNQKNPSPKCEICNKPLSYCSGNRLLSVNFDHKNDNLPIKFSPKTWLDGYAFSKRNIEIWESCNFGILCWECNVKIPTKNRKEWLERVTQYINGS